MKPFKSLLQFISFEKLKDQKEFRKSERYDVNEKIKVTGWLNKGSKVTALKIMNISLYGIGCLEIEDIGIQINDMLDLFIDLENTKIELKVRVVFKEEDRLGLDIFTELDSDHMGYLQLLVPVCVGHTLKEIDVDKSDKEYVKHTFAGVGDSSLTFWTYNGNLKETSDIQMYEFCMEDFIMKIENHQFMYTFIDESKVIGEGEDIDLEKESKKIFEIITLSANDNFPEELKIYLLETIK